MSSELELGVARLAAGHDLGPDQVDQLTRFARRLIDDPTAPTTVRTCHGVLHDHLADSMIALGLPELTQASTIADIGAGAGVPGIILAIALPAARVSLIEANAKKCGFMQRAVADLALKNAAVVNARAEAWLDGLDSCDVVTARALAPLDVVLEYAAPLLRVGGSLVVWRGARDQSAEAAGARAAGVLGFAPAVVHPVKPYQAAEHRHLHVFSKPGTTPARFPRRAGVARKRPLGSR